MPQNGQQQATPALAPAVDEGQATHEPPLPLNPCHCLTRSLHVIICNLFAQVHPHHVAATVAVATVCRVLSRNSCCSSGLSCRCNCTCSYT